MRRNYKMAFLSLLICLFFTNANATNNSITSVKNYSVEATSDGPFDELVSLFKVFIDKISSVSSEEEFKAAYKDFEDQLSELEERYPDYEPNESEMAEIEELFKKYSEELSTTRERLEIDDIGVIEDDDDDEDDDEAGLKLYDEEEVDSLTSYYKNFSNPVDGMVNFFDDFSTKFDESTNIIEFMIHYSTMEAILNNMEDSLENDDFEKAIEDENSEFSKSLARFQQSLINASEKYTANDDTEEVEEITDDIETVISTNETESGDTSR